MIKEQFQREALLLGEEAVQKLNRSTVAVFGLGGVGSFAAEALARAGIGTLYLIDRDVVELTNLNRQLIADLSTVGRKKCELMAERARRINADARVIPRDVFFLPETRDSFDFTAFDYVVDAIDTVSGKLVLIEEAKKAGVPVISAMGAGNKLDPTAFRVSDISATSVDPLARVMRRELKKRGIEGVKVVWSTETPIETGAGRTPGSLSFVPSVMGLIMAGEVVKDLTGVR